MPAHNRAGYIAEAIDSVLSQDYPNKELIVVDDGSTDETVEIIKSYGDQVRLLQQNNLGPAAARNAGISLAQGQYIAFLDSDDLWLPGKLTVQVAYLEAHPEVSLVHVDIFYWFRDSDGKFSMPVVPDPPINPMDGTYEIKLDEQESGWVYHHLLFRPVLSTITAMLRRSLLDEVGLFDVSLKRGEDYDLWFRASRVTPIHKLVFPGALYRHHGDNSAKQYPDDNYELQVIERAIQRWGMTGPDGSAVDPKQVRRHLAKLSFNFGYCHYQAQRPMVAFRSFMLSLQRYPLRAKTWGYLLASAANFLIYEKLR